MDRVRCAAAAIIVAGAIGVVWSVPMAADSKPLHCEATEEPCAATLGASCCSVGMPALPVTGQLTKSDTPLDIHSHPAFLKAAALRGADARRHRQSATVPAGGTAHVQPFILFSALLI